MACLSFSVPTPESFPSQFSYPTASGCSTCRAKQCMTFLTGGDRLVLVYA